ncbi:MAG TPA: efflux RND transporter periplasmic adaptor subunit [Phycisphaerae bacterium]
MVKPQRTIMSRSLDVPATLQAYEQADLYAKTSGYISEVRVDIGDRVQAGDVLAVIDVPEMARELEETQAQHAAKRAALAAAEAHVVQAQKMLEVARSQLQRYRADLALKEATAGRREELFAGKAIPQEQLDEARSQLEIARAEFGIAESKIAAAEADVSGAEAARAVANAEIEVAAARIARTQTLMQYAQIVAPFDGVVTQRTVDRGALVQSATSSRTMPLFTVQRIDVLRVFIEVPESDVAHVQPGSVAKIKPYGWTDAELEGSVARIASSLNPGTRTMRTEIDLPNPDGRLLHGMYAQVVLALDERANALTIPASALLTEGKEAFVYTVRDDRAVRTPVKTGLDDGIRVQVTQGLDDDALVVVTGKGLISAGAAVRPVLKGGATPWGRGAGGGSSPERAR